MQDITNIIGQYIAAWNETDAGRRHALIARTWTEDASYVDPMMEGRGHAAIDALIGGVRERFPDLRFRLLGGVEEHHARVRFSWELAPESGDAVAKGTDFAELADDGRLRTVTGFLDLMPTQ